MQLLFQSILSLVFSLIFVLLISLVSKKYFSTDSFSSPFECGFVPFKNSRGSYSLQFFLLALVFLVFDIEIIILFPVLLQEMNLLQNISFSFFVFIILLFLGLFIEWSQSSLEWMK